MRCCNFFKFVLIYSAFQVAFGLPVMASEISEVPANEVVVPHHIDKIEQPASTEKEDKDLLKASESTDAVIGLHCVEKEELKNSPTSEDKIEQLVDSEKEDKCPCDICISMLAGDKPVKNLTLQINLSFGNNEPVALSPSVSDGHIEQFIKNGFLAKRDTILYFIKNFYDQIVSALNRFNNRFNSENVDLLKFLSSCSYRVELVGDTWCIDLESDTPVNNTTLLEKASLDDTNSRFVEVNLKNK